MLLELKCRDHSIASELATSDAVLGILQQDVTKDRGR